MHTPSTSNSLPLRPFGPSGLRVTPLAIGGSQISRKDGRGGFAVPEAQALALLRAVFAGPINLLDTAAAYGDGESERRIGLALRERGGLPAGFVLSTKADRDLATKDFSADQARRSVERSLRLLGLERIQVLYLHDPEYTTQSFEEIAGPGGALEALVRLKEEGIIQVLGIGAGPIPMLHRYVETGAFDTVLSHNRYTLLNRSAGPLFDAAHRRGLAVVNAAPFAAGILAKGPGEFPKYVYRDAPPDILERAGKMEAACRAHGVPLAAAALQFSLRDPRITTTIAGASGPERIADLLGLANHPIPDALWPELDALAGPDVDPQA